jgi:hypothetical protein
VGSGEDDGKCSSYSHGHDELHKELDLNATGKVGKYTLSGQFIRYTKNVSFLQKAAWPWLAI